MKAFLIAAVVCLTALTFYSAARLTSSSAETITAQLVADALDARVAESQSGMATEIAKLQDDGSALEAEIGTLSQSVQSLTAERDDLAATLDETRAAFSATDVELAAQTASFAVNLARISDLEAQLAERGARLADADATIQTLSETIAASSAASDAMSAEMAALRQSADNAAARVAELETVAVSSVDTDEQVALLQAEITQRDATLGELRASVAALTANLEARDQTTDAPTSQTSSLEAEIEALTASVTERDTLIASLETQLAEAGTPAEDATIEIATLTAALGERDATIAALQAAQTAAAETPKAATEEVDNGEALAALTSEYEARVAGLDAQITELTELMTTQTGTIESLRLGLGEAPVATEELAQVCLARANGILGASQISFGTGTTEISDDSVATLERLRDLAIGCQNDDLIIEIGGHTDSQGAESNNQELSETRAQAVLDFMVTSGIAPASMRAVGFGETQPIETNETAAGRAANRRITFEWQARETASDTPDETTPDTDDDAVSGTVAE